jgi:hypothetical protein
MFSEEEDLRVRREPCRTVVATDIISSVCRRLLMCSGDVLLGDFEREVNSPIRSSARVVNWSAFLMWWIRAVNMVAV